MYLIALLACSPSGTTDKPADTGAADRGDTGDTGDSGEAYPAPSVTILAPTAGAWLYETDRIALEATVTGGRTSPSEVTCAWLTGGGAVVASTGVAADGAVATSGYLAVDTTTLRVECTDLAGQVGTDEVTLTVWPSNQPLPFTLIGPGGTDGTDDITVDDDLTLSVAGTVVLTDSDHLPNRLAPILFYAFPGDEIRVTGTDQGLTEAYLDALALVGPTGEVQPLSDAVCLSSDPTAACYDPSYPTAIPNRFFDATFIVTGP